MMNTSMLSDSESDDDENDGSAPAVELSPSQGDESYVRWQRRFESESECPRDHALSLSHAVSNSSS